jgi:hypothetical protein
VIDAVAMVFLLLELACVLAGDEIAEIRGQEQQPAAIPCISSPSSKKVELPVI